MSPDDYTYVTPTTVSQSPGMIQALDRWLGQYETCYVLANAMQGGLRVKEKEEPYGIPSASRPKPEHLLKALLRTVEALNNKGIRFAVGGGLAVNFYEQERATRDVDFLVYEKKDNLAPILEELSRHDIRSHTQEAPSFMPPDARFWFVPLQFGLPDAPPVDVDLLVSRDELMAFLIENSKTTDVNGQRLGVLGLEGLMVLKLMAFRRKDQLDLEVIMQKNPEYDRTALTKWVRELGLESRLRQMELDVEGLDPRRYG